MARITKVYRSKDGFKDLGRRQLPVCAGEGNLMMIMDLNSKGLCIDSPHIRGKELEEFTRKFNLLTKDELRKALEISSKAFISILNDCVQCVGCRKRVQHLLYQLMLADHRTLDPLVMKNSEILTINQDKMGTPQALGTLLYRHHEILNDLLDSKMRNKTRCNLHSLDAFRSKPFSETWRDVWSSMKHSCREELAVIETKELHDVLENYLKKHKFCNGCRSKIEKAYKILVGEITTKEKGYVAVIYANIKKCHPDKHIHVFTHKIEFLDTLIRRAEPEVNGSYSKLRERHAKTLEVAQEEVLTCVGMVMYERLRRVYISLREEERACQVLAAVGVHALCQSFDMSVEEKQGISNLELLYQEISRAEKAKEHKREQKKLKKKKKKNEKKLSHRISCGVERNSSEDNCAELDEEEEEHAATEDEDVHEENSLSTVTMRSGANEALRVEIENKQIHLVIQNEKKNADQKLNEVEEDADAECEEQENDTNAKNVGKGHRSSNNASPNQQLKKKQKQKQKTKATLSKKNVQNNNSRGKFQKNDKNVSQSTESNALKSGISEKNNICAPIIEASSGKCSDCHSSSVDCPCDVKDSGYGSEPLSHANSRTSSLTSSPEDTSEGSEVSCSDGFCNHGMLDKVDDKPKRSLLSNLDENYHDSSDHRHEEMKQYCDNHDDSAHYQMFDRSFGLEGSCSLFHRYDSSSMSLQQMLDDFDGDGEDDENCYIPQEVVLKYQCQQEKVQQQRMQLRQTLRDNFARLCMKQKRLISEASTISSGGETL